MLELFFDLLWNHELAARVNDCADPNTLFSVIPFDKNLPASLCRWSWRAVWRPGEKSLSETQSFKKFQGLFKNFRKNISCAIACMIMLQNAFNHAHTLNPWDNWQFELHFKVPAQHFPPLTFTSNFHCHLSKQIGYMGLQGFKINVAPWKHLFAWLHWMAGNKIARNWKSKVLGWSKCKAKRVLDLLAFAPEA